MGKAILILEMPECCADCPCSFFERSNPKLNLICGVTQEDANNVGKPDWCPLKPMPKKQALNGGLTEFQMGARSGYNLCIDDIMKGSESDGKID